MHANSRKIYSEINAMNTKNIQINNHINNKTTNYLNDLNIAVTTYFIHVTQDDDDHDDDDVDNNDDDDNINNNFRRVQHVGSPAPL